MSDLVLGGEMDSRQAASTDTAASSMYERKWAKGENVESQCNNSVTSDG